MPAPLENRIVAAEPDPHTFTVRLTWANGVQTVAHFGSLVEDGVFAPLRDPAVFAQCRVGFSGHSLEWPGDLDFCADGLWFEAHPEDNPFCHPRIADVVAGRFPEITVVWEDGTKHTIDISVFIADHPNLDPITCDARFAMAIVGEYGASVFWEDDMEICADVFWVLGIKQTLSASR